ncbi:hypothetical protein A2272_02860 [Candidatus Peregrinibacteria bacterium RIFOXYA12_FULL_33_12]|nr:MAG: hypothetical protein A2272_02860 [Candidatus Peregrinibacteria bacterium RIFOXYA12_FULL_33_12]
MKYILLLRGINVGGNRKVEMKRLKAVLEALGYSNVSTYLNSGNAIFESEKAREIIQKEIEINLEKEFGFAIQVLLKNEEEMKKIAQSIPENWQNNDDQKTDVAFVFPEIDSEKTINELPIKKVFVDIRYVKGAIFWNVDRKNYNKSNLNKIISHKYYKFMTVRNVNTARFLGGMKK